MDTNSLIIMFLEVVAVVATLLFGFFSMYVYYARQVVLEIERDGNCVVENPNYHLTCTAKNILKHDGIKFEWCKDVGGTLTPFNELPEDVRDGIKIRDHDTGDGSTLSFTPLKEHHDGKYACGYTRRRRLICCLRTKPQISMERSVDVVKVDVNDHRDLLQPRARAPGYTVQSEKKSNASRISSSTSGSVPTVQEFFSFPMATGEVNLARVIAPDFRTFGRLLLKDDGYYIDRIAREVHGTSNAMDINVRIFEMWVVNGIGLKPVSWDTLVGVLEDMGRNTLAKDIAQVKC